MPGKRINEVSTHLRSFAREQRSAQTRAEDPFWLQVRGGRFHGHKFKRQVPIAPFVVDFLCASARLIVELDGPPHEADEQKAYDSRRDAFLRRQGFEVVRFTNDDFLGNPDKALDRVREAIEARLESHSPLSRRVAGEVRREKGGGALAPAEYGPSPCVASQRCPSPAEGGG